MDLKSRIICIFLEGFVHDFWSKFRNFLPFFSWFLLKNLHLFSFFFQLKVRNEVFCDLLGKKLSILNQKNVDFKSRKFGIFTKGLVRFFWRKLGNFVLFVFLAKKKSFFPFFPWLLVTNLNVFSFFFQLNNPKQSVLWRSS